jgi:hypothetical protein
MVPHSLNALNINVIKIPTPVAGWPALVKSFALEPAGDDVIGLQPEDDGAKERNKQANDNWSFFHFPSPKTLFGSIAHYLGREFRINPIDGWGIWR